MEYPRRLCHALLAASGSGSAGVGFGGPYENLNVNGSNGGSTRTIHVTAGQGVSLSLTNPISMPTGAFFILQVSLGAPYAAGTTKLPFGMGILSTPIGTGPTVSGTAPWNLNLGAVPAGVYLLQGIIGTESGPPVRYQTTNAIQLVAQ